MKSRYKIITTHKEIDELIGYCKQTKYVSCDFETTGGSYANKGEKPTIMAISFQIGSGYVIPLGHKDSCFKKEYKSILRKFSKEIFENMDIIKICWNLKFEHEWLLHYGCNFKGRIFDGMLAKYLLDEERPNDLKSMVSRFFPQFSDYEDEAHTIANKIGWANVPLEPLSKYCAMDSDLTLRLMVFFEERLMKAGLYNLFRNLIMPASVVLAESEFHGMYVDIPYLDKLIISYGKKIKDNELKLRNHKKLKAFERANKEDKIKNLISAVQQEIKGLEESDKPNAERLIASREEKVSRLLAGEFTNNKERKLVDPFNFNSNPQLIGLFYTHPKGFQFPVLAFTKDQYKRDTDRPSVAEDTLDMLKPRDKSGFIDQLLEHRGLSTLHSTFMVGMKALIKDDGKLHANFKLHGTVTGRLSCDKPNLQNIPRDTTSADVKKMFIAPKGYAILQVDYSQAELRVMAEAANEKAMLEWFNTGKDIHLASACKKYNYDYDKALEIYENEKHPEFKLWKMRRKQAKTINFGIIYCQTAKKLAISLSEPATKDKPAIVVTKDEAQKFLNDFNRDFPAVIRFMKSQKMKAYKDGYVKTFFGRKRRLPNIQDSNDGIRMEAERQSVNAPIQGTASDFALFSSILIREHVIKNNKQAWGLQQIYTVHDSLGYLVKLGHIHDAVPIINKICENPQTQTWFGFKMHKVKMKVDFEISPYNWGELNKYDPKKNYLKLEKKQYEA